MTAPLRCWTDIRRAPRNNSHAGLVFLRVWRSRRGLCSESYTTPMRVAPAQDLFSAS
jgi:hypothetical protein